MTTELFAIRLERGASVPREIEAAAERSGLVFCDVSGFGELEWAEVAPPDDVAAPVRRLQGPLQLLSLRGRIRRAGGVAIAEHHVVLARHGDNGIELLGGRLTRGECRFVELALAPLALPPGQEARPTTTSRAPEAAARTPAIGVDPELAEEAPKVPVHKVDERWAKAVAESRRVERLSALEEEDDTAKLVTGDIVVHQQFGRCVVVKVDDDHITVRKSDSRTVQLGLTVLGVRRSGEENGKSIYNVFVRRGRG